ncbi:epidermis-specific secreted glycoprotein EP1-like [Actinidia eriantha]|uniref:epidermis-specific secreted glycoprotein EP1-like n=1 Tax=Actinidia eriantha TaxID=165200 RepID=UPI002589A0D6|nr:epidermis-specific secreted glycoprotein EP1-like [Actinidia eriantha]
MSPPYPLTLSLLFLLIQTLFSISQATVPASETFQFVNEGEFGDYIVEYDADYRVLSVFNNPFQLCFYNTTPNAFTLALRMGTVRSESLMRWVWEANRGKPVGENATLTFGTDGNLVLAEANGQVVWQTGTANKGVVGFKLLPNGNMVLYDSKGNFVWQSFDSPTDTLLVGQSLRVGAVSKLMSRASALDNSNGPYSFVLEPKMFGLYYKSNNSPKPMIYFSSESFYGLSKGKNIESLTFTCEPDTDEGFAYNLMLEYNETDSTPAGNLILSRPKYNSTLTYLRLGIDGNLKANTFYTKVDWGAWEVTYTLLARNSDPNECQLPERCGKFGLCEDSQCVACPSSNGLLGWSKECEAKKVSSCKPNDISYYRVDEVDHFMSKYTKGNGPMTLDACGKKCTSDCKCLGYFYHSDTSRCWIAYDLKTLTKVANSTHFGYIKVPKK